MQRYVVCVTAAALFIACAARDGAAVRAEEGKKAEARPGETLPRHDGVYRVKRRTTNVGAENRDVYDYLAFTKDGNGYVITGTFGTLVEKGKLLRDVHYLEQPEGKVPGAFHALVVDLKDQPAFILKWVGDPKMKKPLGGKYETKEGVITLVYTDPGSLSGHPAKITLTGRPTPKGMRVEVKRSDTNRTRETTVDYEFEPAK